MRILITGAGGQLGRDLARAVENSPTHEAIALDRAGCDVSERDAVLGAVGATRPDAIIHAAAWTDVDGCEGDPDKAFVANALACRNVAEAARRFDAHLVALSTDYVFDGTKVGAYLEWDEPAPRSVYGRSKLAGEREATTGAPGATVVRTSWVCGEHGPNMVKTVLRLARGRDELSFVDDQRGCPTFTTDLAPALIRCCVDRRPGIIHLTNSGSVSWFEFARAVLEASDQDPERVRPIATGDLVPARPAPRPANSVLENAVWRTAGLAPLRHFREPLAELIEVLLS